ncbi:MAG TPA: 8-oxo-dGTP diphosphatase [Firmicutes bacterium]|nr:8-oxo-dGTP diphosphatase [Bacillota bacterium]
MLKYNLCYIIMDSKILLLNRDYPGWMGCWNGVGGKLEPNESPRGSMIREIREETGISSVDLHFKGLKTWSRDDGSGFGGLYLYIGYVSEDCLYATPKRTDEGILEWKDINWVLHPQNLGVAHDLPSSLRAALTDSRCFDHHSVFRGNHLERETATEIDPQVEYDRIQRKRYLQKYTNHLD